MKPDPTKIPDTQLIFAALAAIMFLLNAHGEVFEEVKRRGHVDLTRS